jgi:hypothetical protein
MTLTGAWFVRFASRLLRRWPAKRHAIPEAAASGLGTNTKGRWVAVQI